jgi:hypothetical protein
MTYFLLDNKRISYGAPFSHNDIQYPPNWLALSTADEREAIGVAGPFEPPSYDVASERLEWNQEQLQYDTIPLSEVELLELRRGQADYLAFWDALMTSSVYASIREQSMTSLPMNTLATEFIALIGDAKAGRANEAAIQQSMNAILFYGTFTEEQLAELQAALVAGHLEGIYTLTPVSS